MQKDNLIDKFLALQEMVFACWVKTVLMHNEDFSGIAIGFADLPPDVIAEGYHQMNMALKSRLRNPF
ncbi:MAG: hypothetical protein GY699_15850 [Desulfobacteraceae bacterium]|nr:hypothetical protein [Desulfobacteraceae bacterium]